MRSGDLIGGGADLPESGKCPQGHAGPRREHSLLSLSLSLPLSHTRTHTHTHSLYHTRSITHSLFLSLSHTHTLSLSLSLYPSLPLAHTHSHTRQAVEALLQAGADREMPDRVGNTPLMWAAKHGRTRVVRLSLKECKILCWKTFYLKLSGYEVYYAV